jgi:hypothetical protein
MFGGDRTLAALGAAIFALHPIHTDAIDSVPPPSQRRTELHGFVFRVSLLTSTTRLWEGRTCCAASFIYCRSWPITEQPLLTERAWAFLFSLSYCRFSRPSPRKWASLYSPLTSCGTWSTTVAVSISSPSGVLVRMKPGTSANSRAQNALMSVLRLCDGV